MIRRHKVWAVASFEFLSDVKRISFIIGVLGMPVFLLAYGGLIAFVGILAERSKPASITYGIVDQANVLTLNSISINTPQLLPEEMRSTIRSIDSTAARFTESVAGTKIVFRPLHHRDSALAALKEKSINGFFLLRSDYLDSGIVDSYIGESEGLNIRDPERAIRTLLVENLLKGSVPEKLAQRIREPWTMGKSWIVKSTGELTERSVGSTLAKVGVPFVFSIVLVLSIVGSGMSLIQGTAVEKENRVVDVLLSSATADEILAGKLLGLGGSGLLQVGAWFGMAACLGRDRACVGTFGPGRALLPLRVLLHRKPHDWNRRSREQLQGRTIVEHRVDYDDGFANRFHRQLYSGASQHDRKNPDVVPVFFVVRGDVPSLDGSLGYCLVGDPRAALRLDRVHVADGPLRRPTVPSRPVIDGNTPYPIGNISPNAAEGISVEGDELFRRPRADPRKRK